MKHCPLLLIAIKKVGHKKLSKNTINEIKHFFNIRYDITIQDNIVYFNNNAVISIIVRESLY